MRSLVRIQSAGVRRRRGATIVELSMAIVILGITVLVGFEVFNSAQTQMLNTITRDRMVQAAQNESERIFSLGYDQVQSRAGMQVQLGNQPFTVDVEVTQLHRQPSTGNVVTITGTSQVNPRWKDVLIRVTAGSGESIEWRVIRAPGT